MPGRDAGSAAFPGAAVLNSTNNASTGPAPTLFGLWVPAGVYWADSLATSLSSDLPSGMVNRTLEAARKIATESGC